MLEENQPPIILVERPEGQVRVNFVDGAEVVIGADEFVVNRVMYRVTIRFKRDGEAWVDAQNSYVRRAGMRGDDVPSHSARTKIWAAAEQVLREAVEADPEILARATAARLRREISVEQRHLADAKARTAQIRRGIEAMQEQQAALTAVRSPTSRYVFALGLLDDDVTVCVDVTALTSEEAVKKLQGFLTRRDLDGPFVVPGTDAVTDGVEELRFYLNVDERKITDKLIEDCEELAP